MDYLSAHFIVSGRVQGVGYRQATAAQARTLGVSGWVRNRDDGRVEGHAQGSAAALDDFQRWLHQGPPLARVTELQWHFVDAAAAETLGAGFEIRR